MNILTFMWMALVAQQPVAGQQAQAIRAEANSAVAAEAERLKAIADQLAKSGEPEAASRVRARMRPWETSDRQRFWTLPDVATEKREPANHASTDVSEIQKATALELFALAKRAADLAEPRFGLADSLLRAVIERDPDHAEARRLLGFIRYKDGWATPHAAEQLRSGKVLHDVFGWVPASWVEHLDRGELPGTTFRGPQTTQWLPAADADALRSDFWGRPWTITTHHFEITTNVPLSEAIAFGRKLEALHQLFFSLFADVIGRARLPLALRFADPKLAPRTSQKRMKVWYFADRREYIDYFQRQFQRDESVSLGYYMPPSEAKTFNIEPRSYFYRDTENPIDATSTLFHEASHQLLFESAGPSRFERNRGHFWVWEGLGTYFETLREHEDGSLEIGGVVGARMRQARQFLIERGELVAIDTLFGMGRDAFLEKPGVYLNYAQSNALAVFLMHSSADNRDRFLDYIRAAYDGRMQKSQDVQSTLGIDPETLSRGLLEYLKSAAEAKP